MGLYLGLFGSAGLLLGLLGVVAILLLWRGRVLRLLAEERAVAERSVADATAGRARAEQALRETQTHFQELLKGRKGYAIFTLDAGGRVRTWGREAEEVYGYSDSEILGRPVSLLYTPAEASAGAADLHLANARSAGRSDHGGWRVRRDGRTFRVRFVLSARRDARGEPDGFWCLTEDLGGQGSSSSILLCADDGLSLDRAGRDDRAVGRRHD